VSVSKCALVAAAIAALTIPPASVNSADRRTTPPKGVRNFTVDYDFRGSGDGEYPTAPLVSDGKGHFFGTTPYGGAANQGSVYEVGVSPSGIGETVIYSFTGGIDGASPRGGLLIQPNGHLFGTAAGGGRVHNGPCSYGCGTIFELIPSGETYREKTLHLFTYFDGSAPAAGLVADASGAFYGTTSQGGFEGSPCYYGCGVVYKLTPKGGGVYAESVIYAFAGGNDGEEPLAPVTLDANGDLFGTTLSGGGTSCKPTGYVQGCGTIFELSPASQAYAYLQLHAFQGVPDGALPTSAVLVDAAGSLYGTTSSGGKLDSQDYCGSSGCGTIFRFDDASGTYLEDNLYAFTPSKGDGSTPVGGLTPDSHGTLYGTTEYGGQNHSGTIFSARASKSSFAEQQRYSLGGGGTSPYFPEATLLFVDGTFFGTTLFGGSSACNDGCGTVFQFKP
jgi:uncharacterized repeat protein (TIGR03803 family)